jgi:hypothetical protein
MKQGMVLLVIVFFAVVLAMPANGAEQSPPVTGTHKKQPLMQVPKQVPPLVMKPDLVVSITSHGNVYSLGTINGLTSYATNIEFTITNKGHIVTGSTGSTFSVGVEFTPLCIAPDCPNGPCGTISQCMSQASCAMWWNAATKSFRFLHPIIIDTPLAAGETRTVLATLVIADCIQASKVGGGTASVFLKVDDKNQVDEGNEINNKSAPISVTVPHLWIPN